MNKSEIKFYSPESYDGKRSSKQHAFKPYEIEYLGADSTNRNAALCSSNRALSNGNCTMDDDFNITNPERMDFSLIESETLDEKNICKKCLKIYNKLA